MKKLSQKGLVITRKRKKWKFAHFDSWENCFSHHRGDDPKKITQQLTAYFQVLDLEVKPLVLELAAGNAQFSLELARRHPDTNFVAIDVKSDRLYTSAKQALQEGVKNIAFLRCQLEPLPRYSGVEVESSKNMDPPIKSEDDKGGVLEQIVGKHAVDEIWITFPDPHPKKRSAKHRLSHPSFLRHYRNILKDTGILKFKTDNRELFLWSLEQFVADNWQFHELSFDLHESNLPDDYKIMTYYEQKFTAQNIPTNFVSVTKN